MCSSNRRLQCSLVESDLAKLVFHPSDCILAGLKAEKKIPALDGEKTLPLDGAVYKRKKSPLVTNGPYFYSIYLSPFQRKFDNFPFSALSLFFKNTDKK